MPATVIMPALELAQETGKVLRWLRAPGDAVTKGEPIVEIETDKVTVEIEAPASGTLGAVSAGAGDVVPVGTTIALIYAAGEAAATAGEVGRILAQVLLDVEVDLLVAVEVVGRADRGQEPVEGVDLAFRQRGGAAE